MSPKKKRPPTAEELEMHWLAAGWTNYNGGHQPCHDDARVDARYANGKIVADTPAAILRWPYNGSETDIMAWRYALEKGGTAKWTPYRRGITNRPHLAEWVEARFTDGRTNVNLSENFHWQATGDKEIIAYRLTDKRPSYR